MLGFGPVIIQSGTTSVITCCPQLPIKPVGLFIPSHIAIGLMVEEFRIGLNSQFVSVNPIPAERFSEREVGIKLACDPCFPGQIISLSIRNTTCSSRVFSAALDCEHIDFDQIDRFQKSARNRL